MEGGTHQALFRRTRNIIWVASVARFPRMLPAGRVRPCLRRVAAARTAIAPKREFAREQLKQDHSQRVNVTARIGVVSCSSCLLGRHVGGSTGTSSPWDARATGLAIGSCRPLWRFARLAKRDFVQQQGVASVVTRDLSRGTAPGTSAGYRCPGTRDGTTPLFFLGRFIC